MKYLFVHLLVGSFLTSFVFAAGNQIDISSIIDRATAESVLEAKTKEALPHNLQGGDGYYSKCNYYSVTPGKTLLLRLYQAADGYNPQEELEVIAKSTPALIEVLGLGDKALLTDGAAGGLPAGALMLYIRKGNNLVTVGLSGIEDRNAALEKVKTIGEKIVSHL